MYVRFYPYYIKAVYMLNYALIIQGRFCIKKRVALLKLFNIIHYSLKCKKSLNHYNTSKTNKTNIQFDFDRIIPAVPINLNFG